MSCQFKMFLPRILRLSNQLRTVTAQFSNLHTYKASSSPISIPLPLREINSNTYNPWLWKQNESIVLPKSNNVTFDLPTNLKINLPMVDPLEKEAVEEPTVEIIEKQAITMLVIRRKKMKKHKIKKLRKRMKFENAKKRQRRELKKEKEFQAKLIKQYTKAEEFCAEDYVSEKINKYKTILETSAVQVN